MRELSATCLLEASDLCSKSSKFIMIKQLVALTLLPLALGAGGLFRLLLDIFLLTVP